VTEQQENELFEQAVKVRDEAQAMIAMMIRFRKKNLSQEIAAQRAELAAPSAEKGASDAKR
jgi:hypothetical protein